MTGHRDYFLSKQDYLKQQVGNPDGSDKPNKKYADPRVWVREVRPLPRRRPHRSSPSLPRSPSLALLICSTNRH
mgnify:CR=1 FL=1